MPLKYTKPSSVRLEVKKLSEAEKNQFAFQSENELMLTFVTFYDFLHIFFSPFVMEI